VNEQEHHELQVRLGPYVLGQLPDDETAELEAHLDGCAACTAELEELTPVASALAAVRRGPASEPAAEPPLELGDRVLHAVSGAARREARRTWRRTAAVAVASAAAVVVAVVALDAVTGEDAPTVPLEAVEVRVDEPGLVASADLVDHTWGVEVKLTATGFDRGGRYRVSVLGVDGRRYPAGGFVGTGRREMDCNLNASVLRDRASGFEVRDNDGAVVASSAFG